MSQFARPHAGPHRLHHHAHLQPGSLHLFLHPQKLLHRDDLRNHHSHIHFHLRFHQTLRLADSLHLHPVDFRVGDAQSYSAVANHGIHFSKFPDHLSDPGNGRIGLRRQELVERQIQQSNDDGQPIQLPEYGHEILFLV